MTHPIRWSRRLRELASSGPHASILTVVGPAFLQASRYEQASQATRTLFGLVQRSDLAITTFPGVLIDGGMPASVTARLVPSAVADDLQAAGIRVVNLATAHLYDAGTDGIKHSLSALRRRGIGIIGAAESSEAARKPWLHSTLSTRLGIVGFRCAEEWGPGYQPPSSGAAVPGSCHVRMHQVRTGEPGAGAQTLPVGSDLRDLLALIRLTKRTDTLAVVMLDMQWPDSTSSRDAVPPWIRQIARLAAQTGADLVFVSGLDRILPVERCGRSYIFYGIGHFFDETAMDTTDLHASLLVRVIAAQGRVTGIEVVPYSRSTGSAPELVEDEIAARVLNDWRESSVDFGVVASDCGWFGRIAPGQELGS